MKWTKTPPSKPGWYWWKPSTPSEGPSLFPVIQRWDAVLCTLEPDPEDECGWFAGPIEPPEESA